MLYSNKFYIIKILIGLFQLEVHILYMSLECDLKLYSSGMDLVDVRTT